MSAAVSLGCEELYALRPGVYSATDDRGAVNLLRFRRGTGLGVLDPRGRDVLRRLAGGPCAVADLHEVADPGAVAALLTALHAGGWLTTTVRWRDRPLYTVQPLRDQPLASTVDGTVVLSRFAVLHREGADLVAESPLASASVRVHDPAVAAVLAALTVPGPLPAGELPADVVTRLVGDLGGAGLVVAADGSREEETEPRLRQWRPHDLWFHQRSRQGNGGYAGLGYGRTRWARGLFDPVPARHEPYPAPPVELFRPDLEWLREHDVPLTAVLEDRASTRTHDDGRPITAAQLGEMLYRCSRVRRSFTADGVEHLGLPYPSGGSVYELELYPVVRTADGLDPGLYHYDRHEHVLRLVRPPGPEVARLLRAAAGSAGGVAPPQVLVVVAARFGRLMHTYEELAYALVLKHVGVLYQTMYLVATAMGLAACGLGGGDAAAFTDATGLDPATEGSVGEFMLGSRAVD
jgi:SagB-type dehydrogenase family enzyme